jgi:hypothetical protein
MTDKKDKWAEKAPEYKKEGKMYSSVEYDSNGNPRRIRVAQSPVRRGTFVMEGSTAVYEPHNLPTLPEAGEEVEQYVEQLPFVQAVNMGEE